MTMRVPVQMALWRLANVRVGERTVAFGGLFLIFAIAGLVVLPEQAPVYQQGSCLPLYITPAGAQLPLYHCSGLSTTMYDVFQVVTWILLVIGLLLVAITWKLLWRRTGSWAMLVVGALLVAGALVGLVEVLHHAPSYQFDTCRTVDVIPITPRTRLYHCSGLTDARYDLLLVLAWVLLAFGVIMVAFTWRLVRALPTFWGIMYLGLIPLAAWIYTLDASQFYDANLAREPATISQKQQVEQSLTNLLSIRGHAVGVTVPYEGLRWFVGAVSVENISISPASTTLQGQAFDLFLWCELSSQETVMSNGHRIQRQAGVPLSVALTYVTNTIVNNKQYTQYSATLTSPSGDGRAAEELTTAVFNVLFPIQPGGSGIRFELGRIDNNRLTSLEAVASGDPSASPALYVRMLYLSATVVTTLGIGDIQPLGTASRAWVTAEAILGVLFAGLFLNALAQRYRHGG